MVSQAKKSAGPIHPVVVGIILAFVVVVTVNAVMIFLAIRTNTAKTTETAYEDAQQFNETQAAEKAFTDNFSLKRCFTEAIKLPGQEALNQRTLICYLETLSKYNHLLEQIPSISLKLFRPNDSSADQTFTLNRLAQNSPPETLPAGSPTVLPSSIDILESTSYGYDITDGVPLQSGMYFGELSFRQNSKLYQWRGKIWL